MTEKQLFERLQNWYGAMIRDAVVSTNRVHFKCAERQYVAKKEQPGCNWTVYRINDIDLLGYDARSVDMEKTINERFVVPFSINRITSTKDIRMPNSLSHGENHRIPMSEKALYSKLKIEKVIVNKRTVIVFLKDGRKGISVCDAKDIWDFSIGFSQAYMYAIATNGNKTIFKKIVDKINKKRKRNQK